MTEEDWGPLEEITREEEGELASLRGTFVRNLYIFDPDTRARYRLLAEKERRYNADLCGCSDPTCPCGGSKVGLP
tara:strand:+ start:1567 stop:1791 length:225 start_codon:yes stop_codon:yes gene_type:complete